VPFRRLPEWDVLEIGVGSGSHAQLLAPHCQTYTGIDLTDYAVTSTRTRLALLGLPGSVERMDAEQMGFADETFDCIWTWCDPSPANTDRVLGEMHRVLRRGGTASVMVYHRSALYTLVYAALLCGIFGGGFRRHSLHELLQLNTDGAIARFYRRGEWRTLVEARGFGVDDERVMGQKSEVLLLPAGRIKDWLMKFVPDQLTRFVTNACGQGSFLITAIRKP
jgi:SAM-dependent methyltransferase